MKCKVNRTETLWTTNSPRLASFDARDLGLHPNFVDAVCLMVGNNNRGVELISPNRPNWIGASVQHYHFAHVKFSGTIEIRNSD